MKTQSSGMKENEEGIVVCEKCGCNSAQGTLFSDGLNFVEQSYKCDQCGAIWTFRIDYEPGDIDYKESEGLE